MGAKLSAKTIRPWQIYMLLGAVFLFSVLTISYSYRVGLQAGEEYSPLVDAAMEIKLEATAAHLWFEEIISNDPYLEIDDIWAKIDESMWYTRAMLYGGENSEGRYVPLDDPMLQKELQEVLRKQEAFKTIAHKRWEEARLSGAEAPLLSGPGIGSKSDQAFDAVFLDFINQADRVETRLQQIIHEKIALFKSIQVLLIALNGVFFALTAAVVVFYFKQRAAAQAVIEKNEKRYRMLVENASEGILLSDTGPDLLIDANPVACEMLEYSAKELKRLSFYDLQILNTMTQSLEHDVFEKPAASPLPGESLTYEAGFRRKDGSVFPAEVSLNTFIEHGKTLQLAMVRDITERKRMEQEILAAKDLAEKANSAKSIFLANMSHEIRTPLNGVMGMLQLLNLSEVNDEQKQFTSTAITSCRRLTRLLSDILDISKVEAGRLQIVQEEFSLQEVMSSLENLLSPSAMQAGIKLSTHIAPGTPVLVTGDQQRLSQILFNLAGNGVKFTAAGEVRVEVCALPATARHPQRLLFSVSDTGIGIPPAQLGRIFETFTQVDETWTRQHQGVGLGLSIVNRLVDLMHGHIYVDSEQGVGTSFYVTLPFSVVQEAAPQPFLPRIEQTVAPVEYTKVLLIEDDETNRLAIRQLLEQLNFSVGVAEDGLKGLDMLMKQDFDFVLMDIKMPVLDGVQTTREIRTNPEFQAKADIPIIAVTAYAMAGDKEKYLTAGMDDYITKPVELDSIMEAVSRVAEKRKLQ